MTKSVNGDLRIFTGNANPALAQKICEHLNMDLGKLRVENLPMAKLMCKFWKASARTIAILFSLPARP